MDILTQGRAVFRALNLLHEKEYHEAIVEFLSDLPEPSRAAARNRKKPCSSACFRNATSFFTASCG